MLRTTMLSMTAAAALAIPAFAQDSEMNIVETAQEAGNFSTLIQAVEAAGLAETLTGEGPYTVFAPTDEAFEALPEGTLDELLMEENQEQLADILTYHVVEGETMSSDITEEMSVTTVNGAEAEITIDPIAYAGAEVTEPDIAASNGVIHVIDTVVMPPEDM